MQTAHEGAHVDSGHLRSLAGRTSWEPSTHDNEGICTHCVLSGCLGRDKPYPLNWEQQKPPRAQGSAQGRERRLRNPWCCLL